MTAGEYCNREVIISEQNASVTEVAVLMRQHHVGDLVVVEKQGGKTLPIGIVTDRDIVVEVIAQKADPDSLIINIDTQSLKTHAQSFNHQKMKK
jgi:CBS domain-containing protein